ncbi:MAG TPA: enoyl-CoA hydratase-related protein [Acidimicrobiales bacterium]|jgi:2-(1,2-epoxy-1,2-dihydrophenyl)acetyl-CoA isomerase|nr:enoyl-CoA hydratase-related protein [Acidimicrobiales bacterium]
MTAEGLASFHPDIHVEREGHLTTVTLDRPASRNACNGDMWVALGATFQQLGTSGARVVVLTGAGGNFCSGADLTPSTAPSGGAGGRGGGSATANNLDGMRVLADVVLAVHRCPVPVVAKVDGLCVGAGLGLALAADLTWSSDRARFCAIFAKRGLSMDFGTSWLLRQRIGVHKAKELAFTSRMLSGTEAFELGLVNAAVPFDDLDRAVQEVVDQIAAGPPMALSLTKRELDGAGASTLAEALEVESLSQSINIRSDDMREAFTAYAERREPKFTGR